jgi:hypothetical protein
VKEAVSGAVMFNILLVLLEPEPLATVKLTVFGPAVV